LKDTGETAKAAPKVKEAQTLRQKDRMWTKLWKALNAPKKLNLSGNKDRAHELISCALFVFSDA
jgi:hypothetical protein